MSSSTALLPKPNKVSDDHPIFLRVCHSPWAKIGQKALIVMRVLTASYLTISLAMICDYEVKGNKHGWSTAFEFPIITYGLLAMYEWITALWTFMHLHYPHHNSQPRSDATRFQKFLSPPRTHTKTKNRVFFSIFYTAAISFPWLALLVHWAIEIPTHHATIPAHEIFHHGWLRSFFVLNKYAIVCFLSILEVFVYSSIRRQHPIWSHVLGLCVLLLAYIGWAFVGHEVAYRYPYFWLDHRAHGWGMTIGGSIIFIVVGLAAAAFNYGITALRELVAKLADHKKKSGYTSLPQ